MTDPERQNPCRTSASRRLARTIRARPGRRPPPRPPEQPPLRPGSAAEPYASAGACASGQPPVQGQPWRSRLRDGRGQPGPPYGARPARRPSSPAASSRRTTALRPAGRQPPYQQPPVPPRPPYQPQAYAHPALPTSARRRGPGCWAGCLLVVVLGLGGCVELRGLRHRTSDDGYNGSFGPRYDDGCHQRTRLRVRLWQPTATGHNDGDGDSGGYEGSRYRSTSRHRGLRRGQSYGSLPGQAGRRRGTPGVFEARRRQGPRAGPVLRGGRARPRTRPTSCVIRAPRRAPTPTRPRRLRRYVLRQLLRGARGPGDLIVFAGPKGSHLYPAAKASVEAASPYQSGVYRVGIDVPAGTYAVTVQAEASAATEYESAAYVMKDLEFEDDSIVETKYVIAGGSQTITVTDGQYVAVRRGHGAHEPISLAVARRRATRDAGCRRAQDHTPAPGARKLSAARAKNLRAPSPAFRPKQGAQRPTTERNHPAMLPENPTPRRDRGRVRPGPVRHAGGRSAARRGRHARPCRAQMELADVHRNAMGNVMGGAIFTLADFALAICCNIGEEPTVSVDSDISFFRATKGTKLHRHGHVRQAGPPSGLLHRPGGRRSGQGHRQDDRDLLSVARGGRAPTRSRRACADRPGSRPSARARTPPPR